MNKEIKVFLALAAFVIVLLWFDSNTSNQYTGAIFLNGVVGFVFGYIVKSIVVE